MKINFKKEKGITLIALVITIIILLILAGVSISALTQTGLFGKAKQAKAVTEQKKSEENAKIYEYEQLIEKQGEGNIFTNVDTSKTNPEAAMPTGATIIEGDATKGIVIKDSKDNEWVWVEVPKTIFKNTTKVDTYNNIKTDLIEYATEYREGKAGQGLNWTDEWYEGDGIVATNDKTGEEVYNEMYNKMLSSIYINGGFWISRYEIGDATATNNNYSVRTSDSGISGLAVSKLDQIPYNYVTCGEAQTLASGMSTDTNKTSSLLFGIQWDLTCKFLQEKGKLTVSEIKGGDNVGSKNWGNYLDSSLTLHRGKYNINAHSSTSVWTSCKTDTPNHVTSSKTSDNTNYSELLTTGASEETNKMNIYDFAGNEREWTLEHATSTEGNHSAGRGGGSINLSYVFPASSRSSNKIDDRTSINGFRSTLY